MTATADDGWARILPADPRPWLLGSAEPAARWIALTALLDRPPDDPEVVAAHVEVLADPGTRSLVERIPTWGAPLALPGHDSALFAPNLLELLATMGVGPGDEPRIEATLDAMLVGRASDGRLATFATSRVTPDGAWSALLCDTHAIVGALVRYGRGDDPAVVEALARMADGIVETTSGAAWPCVPWGGFRGPGRKGDRCPQVTLEALAAFARIPAGRRPPAIDRVARDALAPWRGRADATPYMFGHGARFKTVKWPSLWYDVLRTVETLALYPAVWDGPAADRGGPPRRRRARRVPRGVQRGRGRARHAAILHARLRGHSFGQKKAPSRLRDRARRRGGPTLRRPRRRDRARWTSSRSRARRVDPERRGRRR